MGCNEFLTKEDDALIEASMRGENTGFSSETLEEWRELQSPEARQEMFEQIDKLSEEAKEAGERPSIPPENLKDWAEYLDIMNRDLDLAREEIPERLMVVPEIKNLENSGIIDNRDMKHELVTRFSAKQLALAKDFIYSGEQLVRVDRDTGKTLIIEGTTRFDPLDPTKPATVLLHQQRTQIIPPEKISDKMRELIREIVAVRDLKEGNFYLTGAHEMGHPIYRSLPQEIKDGWDEKCAESQAEGRGVEGFIDKEARDDFNQRGTTEEDLVRCLALYKEAPFQLFVEDIEKFRELNELTRRGMI